MSCPQEPELYLLRTNSKDAKLTTHLICCAEAPASVPRLQVEALDVRTLCARMFQPRTSPRRYLQYTLISHVFKSHTNRSGDNIKTTHPCCVPCYTPTTCSHKWFSHVTASSQLKSVAVAGTELLSVAPAPEIPITQVTPSLLWLYYPISSFLLFK